jgi:hypothetical protein
MVEFLSLSAHGGRGGNKKGAASTSTMAASASAAAIDGGAFRRGQSLTRNALSPKSSPSSSHSPRRSLSRTRNNKNGTSSNANANDPWHDDLKSTDSTRRSKVGNLLEMIQLNVASYKDLLDDSSLETAKAHRMLLGVAQVHELMSERSTAAAGGTLAGDDPALQGPAPVGSSSSFLVSLQQSEEVVAQNFMESADQLRAVAAKLLKGLAEIQDCKADLDDRGTKILAALRSDEERTVAAWGMFPKGREGERESCTVFLPCLLLRCARRIDEIFFSYCSFFSVFVRARFSSSARRRGVPGRDQRIPRKIVDRRRPAGRLLFGRGQRARRAEQQPARQRDGGVPVGPAHGSRRCRRQQQQQHEQRQRSRRRRERPSVVLLHQAGSVARRAPVPAGGGVAEGVDGIAPQGARGGVRAGVQLRVPPPDQPP